MSNNSENKYDSKVPITMMILVTIILAHMNVVTGTLTMINDDSKAANMAHNMARNMARNMAKGSLFRKLPIYGRMSRGSLTIMFVMSSSCEQHSE